ncbi:hypothetical protein EON63_23215, partial [archaeon]
MGTNSNLVKIHVHTHHPSYPPLPSHSYDVGNTTSSPSSDIENDPLDPASKRGKKSKQPSRQHLSSTIERNVDNLNMAKLEHEVSLDPMFHHVSKAFDAGGGRGLLMYTMQMADELMGYVFPLPPAHIVTQVKIYTLNIVRKACNKISYILHYTPHIMHAPYNILFTPFTTHLAPYIINRCKVTLTLKSPMHPLTHPPSLL